MPRQAASASASAACASAAARLRLAPAVHASGQRAACRRPWPPWRPTAARTSCQRLCRLRLRGSAVSAPRKPYHPRSGAASATPPPRQRAACTAVACAHQRPWRRTTPRPPAVGGCAPPTMLALNDATLLSATLLCEWSGGLRQSPRPRPCAQVSRSARTRHAQLPQPRPDACQRKRRRASVAWGRGQRPTRPRRPLLARRYSPSLLACAHEPMLLFV